MSTLSSTYYDWNISQTSTSFANLVQTREYIEDGLKVGKIKNYQTFFEQSSSDTGGSKKRISLIKGMKRMGKKFMQSQAPLPNTSHTLRPHPSIN